MKTMQKIVIAIALIAGMRGDASASSMPGENSSAFSFGSTEVNGNGSFQFGQQTSDEFTLEDLLKNAPKEDASNALKGWVSKDPQKTFSVASQLVAQDAEFFKAARAASEDVNCTDRYDVRTPPYFTLIEYEGICYPVVSATSSHKLLNYNAVYLAGVFRATCLSMQGLLQNNQIDVNNTKAPAYSFLQKLGNGDVEAGRKAALTSSDTFAKIQQDRRAYWLEVCRKKAEEASHSGQSGPATTSSVNLSSFNTISLNNNNNNNIEIEVEEEESGIQHGLGAKKNTQSFNKNNRCCNSCTSKSVATNAIVFCLGAITATMALKAKQIKSALTGKKAQPVAISDVNVEEFLG
jgi:hypothetical protein